MSISFETWPQGQVAPSLHQVEVAAPRPGPPLEPVSSRLKGTLPHPQRMESIGNLKFSPDGTRLLASDYPGGVVQVWDVESHAQLATIETGYGYRADSRHIFLSPDWRSLYSWQENRPPPERYEADGRQMIRYRSDSTLSVWDVETGELRRTFAHDPPRGIRVMRLSPDGSTFMTLEELPGEYELSAPLTRAASLWNVETGESRPIPGCGIYSQNGRTIAFSLTDGDRTTAIQLMDVATGEEMLSIPIIEESAQAGASVFSPDGRLLVGSVWEFTERRARDDKSYLRFWDAETGRELASFSGEEVRTQASADSFSPNGKLFAAVNWQSNDGRVPLLDLNTMTIAQTVYLPEKANVRGFAFSPDGRWLAVITQVLPERGRYDASAEDLAQPRIHLVDVATAEVRETLVAPQAVASDLRFSPDGRTLASSGQGKVLLWDLSTPPGSGAAAAVEIERHDR